MTEPGREYLTVGRTFRVMLYLVFAFIIGLTALIGWGLAQGGAINHAVLAERQDELNHKLDFLTCIVLIPPGERDAAAVNGCREAGSD